MLRAVANVAIAQPCAGAIDAALPRTTRGPLILRSHEDRRLFQEEMLIAEGWLIHQRAIPRGIDWSLGIADPMNGDWAQRTGQRRGVRAPRAVANVAIAQPCAGAIDAARPRTTRELLILRSHEDSDDPKKNCLKQRCG